MNSFDFDKELRELSQLRQKKAPVPVDKKGQRGMKPVVILAGVLLLITGLWLFLREPQKPNTFNKQDAVTAQKDSPTDTVSKETSTPIGQSASQGDTAKESIITSVRLRPTNPTILDSVKAEVELISTLPQDRIQLKYQWFVNNTHLIEGVDTEMLPAGKVKRGNYVNVRVIELRDGETISQKVSDMVMVHNSAPSLSMRVLNNRIKKGDVIEIQLSSSDADGDRLTFSLDEAPSGMTLDSATGKITYRPNTEGQGDIKFRASVTDSEGAKTSGNYEVSFNVQGGR
jgi:translation initiation factor IF-1